MTTKFREWLPLGMGENVFEKGFSYVYNISLRKGKVNIKKPLKLYKAGQSSVCS